MDPNWRAIAGRALAAHPSPSAEELEDAASIVGRFLENRRNRTPAPVIYLGLAGVGLPLIPLMVLAVTGLLSAATFRGGLLYRLLGVGVVNAFGEETSRVRAFMRAAIAWSPFVIVALTVFFALDVMEPSGELSRLTWLPLSWIVFLVMPGALLTVVAWSASNPRSGLQDRIARTYLVPR
jgi:hypothetical protein